MLGLEEGRLFGAEWLQALRAIPNEYLYYYDFTRDSIAQIREAGQTRGEFLLGQQADFYDAVRAPGQAGELWRRVRRERNATYMGETRADGEQRTGRGVEGGGYEGVALALMAAISRSTPGDAHPQRPQRRGAGRPPRRRGRRGALHGHRRGPRAAVLAPVDGHQLGTMQQVKAVEQAVIEAATTGSADAALRAFALHPLVDSVSTARRLLAGYRAASPEVDALLS